jgi:hypothetical protein
MGLFYTRQHSVAAAVGPRLRAAHLAPAAADAGAANTTTDQETTAIEQETRPTFSVPRFVCAVILVLVLFGFYVWSAHDTKMAAQSDALFTLFQALTSGLTGVLVGESALAIIADRSAPLLEHGVAVQEGITASPLAEPYSAICHSLLAIPIALSHAAILLTRLNALFH